MPPSPTANPHASFQKCSPDPPFPHLARQRVVAESQSHEKILIEYGHNRHATQAYHAPAVVTPVQGWESWHKGFPISQ